jgi:DNA primase
MDMLMSWQAGVKNTVASSGTALTAEHLVVLRRNAEELLFSFDMDDAGWAAAERALSIAAAQDFSVKFVSLPDKYKDIADAVAEDPKILEDAIANAKPAFEALMRRHLAANADFALRENVRQLRTVLAILARLQSPVERANWMRVLSNYTGLPIERLTEELANLPTASNVATSQQPAEGKTSATVIPERLDRWSMLSAELLSYCAQTQEFDLINPTHLSPRFALAFTVLREGGKSSPDAAIDALLNELILRGSTMTKEEAQDAARQLSAEWLKKRREALIVAVKRAESAGSVEEAAQLIQQLQQLR